MIAILLLFAACGGLGAALRYILDTLLQERARMHPALSIVLINALGSFLLGYFGADIFEPSSIASLLIVFGCGGFTTFSTASLDTYKLLRQRAFALAAAHGFGQLALCVALASAGFLIAQRA
ncbi:CrcB family protein [uncultured Gulosibacter sp.]|uniref:fluoride efflux transporter FluC n=1 Tax=uncultured Gulosibacter sp. TaxID=1339167 RepID=UPI00288925C4|nr:CrcB family protein [uncultured Gulosibacter sp.]